MLDSEFLVISLKIYNSNVNLCNYPKSYSYHNINHRILNILKDIEY